MLKKFAVIALLAAATVGIQVQAANFGAAITLGQGGQGYAGNGGGYSESATNGGSMGETKGYGASEASAFTKNAGSGYSFAGTTVNPTGVGTYTNGGSDSSGYTKTANYGLGTAESAGGVGSDFGAKAWGEFKTYQHDGSNTVYGHYSAY